MNDIIKTLCQAIEDEAEAIMNATERMEEAENHKNLVGLAKIYALSRLDAVEHIQNLTIELTRLVSNVPVPISKEV